MSESLRNNLIQACEGERISLHCPRNTHIVMENSFYGRLVPSEELCPAPRTTALRPLDNSTGEESGDAERRLHDEDIGCAFTQAHSVGWLCENLRSPNPGILGIAFHV
jgi:hypothetical protein